MLSFYTLIRLRFSIGFETEAMRKGTDTMSTNKEHSGQERLLCSRKKNVEIFLLPSGRQFRVISHMEDGTHEMRLNMVVNQPSLRIKTIDCEMRKVPDALCRSARAFFDTFIGRRVAPGLLSDLKQAAHEGCTHLINLFHDACYTLKLAQAQLGREHLNAMFPDLNENQLYKFFLWFQPEMRNSCVRYAKDSPYMDMLAKVEMPKGAAELLDQVNKKDTTVTN
jgi:hypothetical protein